MVLLDKDGKLSFENTQRILTRQRQIASDLMYYIDVGFRESEKQMREEVNKKLYELAEKTNISLYDLCFQVVPRMRAIEPRIENMEELKASQFKAEYEMVLEPMPLQFEKGPDYWEAKYRKLKAKIQELIEDADKA